MYDSLCKYRVLENLSAKFKMNTLFLRNLTFPSPYDGSKLCYYDT